MFGLDLKNEKEQEDNEQDEFNPSLAAMEAEIKPQIISTGNIGCITQISNGTNIPIVHTIEILDWYTGGPKPGALI